jgi:hypothetical protein
MRTCHRCGAEVTLETIGVRDTCEKCRAYLHCCRNCEHHSPGMHNDCRETRAELVADKEQGNFCDFFRAAAAPRGRETKRGGDARAALDRLFKKKGA